MKWMFYILSVLVLFSCEEKMTVPSLAYMPSTNLLESGVVAKFYKHSDKAKGGQKKTDIGYRKYQLKGEFLNMQDFNAEFSPTYASDIRVTDGQWISKKEVSTSPGTNLTQSSTSTAYNLKDTIQLNWDGQTSKKSKTITQYNWTSKIIDYQKSKKDTTYEGRSAVIFTGTRDFERIKELDTISDVYTWKRLYAKGLGLVYFESYSSEHKYIWELAELISTSEYKVRKNHGLHRVGWIDTAQVLDIDSQFSTCHHFDRICDYYNDERAVFKGKKGALRALLEEKLDKSKIKGESGYLTYRFVINCEGEAGWFTTEEADLKYNRKQFSNSCRNHLFEIFNSANTWKSLKIRGEERDAYVYITLKIKDGEIIEILP